MESLKEKSIEFRRLTRLKREHEKLAAEYGSQAAAIGIELSKLAEDAGLRNLPMDDGCTISFPTRVSAKQLDAAAIVAWFKTNGMEHMLNPNGNSLNALCRERAESGLPPPDGVEVTFVTTASLRDGGGSDE